MPFRGRGRPAKNSGQATSILGDLEALSSDDLANLKDVKVSFTCKKCGAKSPTLKNLIEHLGTECKVGLKPKPAPVTELTADGTPKRGRGRPRKGDTVTTPSVKKTEDSEPEIILPEAPGRVTRISSGSLKRKSAVELLSIKAEEEEDVDEEDGDEDDEYEASEEDDEFVLVPKSTRGRGRPRKYPRVGPSFEEIEQLMNEQINSLEGEHQEHEGPDQANEEGESGESRSIMGLKGRSPRVNRSYKCEICKNRFFVTIDELTIHTEAHVGGDPGDPEKYQCKICNYEATLWSRMLFHLVTHDEFKDKLRDTESVKNVYGKFVCPYPNCNKVFDKKLNMTSHWRKVHHKIDRTCEVCETTLNAVDEKTFIRHVEKCRNVTLQCSECDYQTNVSSNMKKHMKIHTGEGFTCTVCNALFPTKQRLTIHEQIHNKDRPRYMCEVCTNTFCSEDAVKKHIARMHTEHKRDWQCTKCTYVAKLEIDLRKHENIVHNKKFKCEECDYMTNTEKSFLQHKEYHQPDRTLACPFQEPTCYFRASSSKQLSTHVTQAHNMTSKHQCPICMKFFKKKTHLLRHLVTHTQEKPYQCRECGESFYSHSTYYRHRHKTGHDAKREGIVSVPQNITIQYLEEVPDDEKNQIQGAMDSMPVQELEKLLSAEGINPNSLPSQVMIQSQGEEDAAAHTIIMQGEEHEGTTVTLDENMTATDLAATEVITEEVAQELQSVLAGDKQSQDILQQQTEAVTYVLKVEGPDGQTHEVTLDPGADLAESIANLQSGEHQIVYEEPQQVEPVPERHMQAVVEVEPTSSGSKAPQYAIVVWPEGDEPEAALSMLQLQQGSQSQ